MEIVTFSLKDENFEFNLNLIDMLFKYSLITKAAKFAERLIKKYYIQEDKTKQILKILKEHNQNNFISQFDNIILEEIEQNKLKIMQKEIEKK